MWRHAYILHITIDSTDLNCVDPSFLISHFIYARPFTCILTSVIGLMFGANTNGYIKNGYHIIIIAVALLPIYE